MHVTKIKKLYGKQARAMMEAMDRYFPPTVKYTKPQGGMFLWVTLPEGMSAMSLFPKALEKKLRLSREIPSIPTSETLIPCVLTIPMPTRKPSWKAFADWEIC